jgi:hypothetical protein
MGEKLNDYDLYFRNEQTAWEIANYYIKQFNSQGLLKTTAAASCNPELKRMKRANIKGNFEDRIVIYMKSAGVASESQEKYEYFEMRPEISTDNFMDSLSEGLVEDKVMEEPLETAEELLEIVRKKDMIYKPVFFSENAISLTNKIQLVIRFYGEPSEIHENYDFAHSMCYYDYGKHHLEVTQEALESMLSKTLIYKGSLYPVASVFRIRKFLNRGWRISAGQILKILIQISDVNLKDPAILREQLIGVDQAYMWQLLREIENNKTDKIDATYLAKLIDTIFEED